VIGLGTFVPPVAQGVPATGGAVAEVRSALLTAIHERYRSNPRSRQTAVGPSQVGHPCGRNLAFLASGHPRSEQYNDPWPSILGTAAHAWLAETLEQYPTIWITERRVHVGGGMSGSGDAFHIPTGTVVDFKVLGNTTFTQLRNEDPASAYWFTGGGQTYRTQLQCYGTGFVNAGFQVRHVTLAVLGRAKRLSDLYMVPWEYDPAVSQRALARLQAARTLASAGVHPMAVPAQPGHCHFCPFKGSESDGLCEAGNN